MLVYYCVFTGLCTICLINYVIHKMLIIYLNSWIQLTLCVHCDQCSYYLHWEFCDTNSVTCKKFYKVYIYLCVMLCIYVHSYITVISVENWCLWQQICSAERFTGELSCILNYWVLLFIFTIVIVKNDTTTQLTW